MSKLTELAAKTKDCPACRGAGQIPCECVFDSVPHSKDKCPTCKGKGKVLLIEGLRKPCSKCHGAGFLNTIRFGGPPQPEDRYDCPTCNGTSQVVANEDKAFRLMVRWWLQTSAHWLSMDRASDGDFVVTVRSYNLDKFGKEGSLANALADAILQTGDMTHDKERGLRGSLMVGHGALNPNMRVRFLPPKPKEGA